MNHQAKLDNLLQQMGKMASALITSIYITDFTLHDTGFIRSRNAETPFIWFVYESGTHIYAMDNGKEIRNFLQMLDHYENYSRRDFCLYRYDGEKLFPVFPKITRVLVEKELTKYVTLKN